MRYAGALSNGSYQVLLEDSNPLPLHHQYTKSRNWHVEAARRQLALDLIIHALGEEVPADLRETEALATVTSAWLPHLHFEAGVLRAMVAEEDYNQWSVDGDYIVEWIDAWAMRWHIERSEKRYGGAWRGVDFTTWSLQFIETMSKFNVSDVGRLKLGRPSQYQYYLAGYTPEGMAVAWAAILMQVRDKSPI
jgi:hypothetical protein